MQLVHPNSKVMYSFRERHNQSQVDEASSSTMRDVDLHWASTGRTAVAALCISGLIGHRPNPCSSSVYTVVINGGHIALLLAACLFSETQNRLLLPFTFCEEHNICDQIVFYDRLGTGPQHTHFALISSRCEASF